MAIPQGGGFDIALVPSLFAAGGLKIHYRAIDYFTKRIEAKSGRHITVIRCPGDLLTGTSIRTGDVRWHQSPHNIAFAIHTLLLSLPYAWASKRLFKRISLFSGKRIQGCSRD
ncbi:hypothetical protein Tco_0238232 [Tanacetum coccineum]